MTLKSVLASVSYAIHKSYVSVATLHQYIMNKDVVVEIELGVRSTSNSGVHIVLPETWIYKKVILLTLMVIIPILSPSFSTLAAAQNNGSSSSLSASGGLGGFDSLAAFCYCQAEYSPATTTLISSFSLNSDS
jgi:hypothetical protein